MALWVSSAARDVLRICDYATGILQLSIELEGVPKTADEMANDEEAEEGDAHGVMSVTVTDAMTCVVVWANGLVKSWKIPQGDEIFQLQAQDEVSEVAVSRSGSTLVTASAAHASVWNLQSGKQYFEVGNYENISAVCVTESGSAVGLALGDGTVAIYGVEGKLRAKFRPAGQEDALSMALSATGNIVAVASSQNVVVVTDAKGKVGENSPMSRVER